MACLVALIIKKKSGTISKILNEQNLILNRQIQDFWVCSTKGVGESMVGYWLLFFLVWGYKKDSLKGSLINFQDFHLQSRIQASSIFIPLLQLPGFYPSWLYFFYKLMFYQNVIFHIQIKFFTSLKSFIPCLRSTALFLSKSRNLKSVRSW